MKARALAIAITISLLGSSTYATASRGLALVCNEVNSIYFETTPDAKTSPTSMAFNNDRLMYCGRKGNVLEYRRDECSSGSSVIRYDWITLQLMLNDAPRTLTMKCVKR